MWPPAPGFLLGESHAQRSLAGYCPQGGKQLNTTEAHKHARERRGHRRRYAVTQWCPALYNSRDCSAPGFSALQYPQSLFKVMSAESVMPCSHLILCCPLLLSLSTFCSIRVFSNELTPHQVVNGLEFQLVHQFFQ